MTRKSGKVREMDQPITVLDAIIIALFAIGGICGGFVTVKVLAGYVRGMRP